MIIVKGNAPFDLKTISLGLYEESQAKKNNIIWDMLSKYTIAEALEWWLATLSPLTSTNYRSGMKVLIEKGYVNPESTLQVLSLMNSDTVVDRIKKESVPGGEIWTEATRQARAACYISFTGFLCRRSQGMIKKATPCKEGTNRTFFKVRDKVKTEALSVSQWMLFLDALAKINARDYLIAKMILQGGKRISEVLSLDVTQINWQKGEITFAQSKTKGTVKETVISYPSAYIESLMKYVGVRADLVFVTQTGKKVMIGQLATTFEKAGIKANLPFKITPHVLRASTVTYLKQQGFSDSDIMKVTGHASSSMIYAYDKSSRSDNASKKVCLI